MVKKLLFVDDRSKRIHYALKMFCSPYYETTIAPNFFEAMRALSREEWDEVSLDHDLDGCDFQDPDSPTCGMEIIRYIEKTGWPEHKKKPVFLIHSSNLFAVHLMTVRLRALGFFSYYEPIVYPDEHMKYDEKGVPL